MAMKVGIVGAGFMADYHVRGFRSAGAIDGDLSGGNDAATTLQPIDLVFLEEKFDAGGVVPPVASVAVLVDPSDTVSVSPRIYIWTP